MKSKEIKTMSWDEAVEIITQDPYFQLSTLEKIETFKNHPKGWDFGVGNPAPQEVCDEAIKIHEFGTSLGLLTDAFPETEGGIAIGFRQVGSDEFVDIIVYVDMTYGLTHEKGIGLDYDILKDTEEVSLEDAKEYIKSWKPLPPLKEGQVVKD